MNIIEKIILTLCGQGWEIGHAFAGGQKNWWNARRHRLTGRVQVRMSETGKWITPNQKTHRVMFLSVSED
jgi:hypothetical protein